MSPTLRPLGSSRKEKGLVGSRVLGLRPLPNILV